MRWLSILPVFQLTPVDSSTNKTSQNNKEVADSVHLPAIAFH